MKILLLIFNIFAIYVSAFGQCPAWDSLGLGVSHSDNIGLLKLTCPNIFYSDNDVLLRSANNERTISILFSENRESIIGFIIHNLSGSIISEFLLPHKFRHDPEYEFGLLKLLAHSSTDFSKFKFVLSINDQVFSVFINSKKKILKINKVFGNGASLFKISTNARNRMDYLHTFSQLEITNTKNLIDPTASYQTIQAISVNNDTVKYNLNYGIHAQSIVFVSEKKFYLTGPDLLWLCEFSGNEVIIISKILDDVIVFQNSLSFDSTRGVTFILDSVGMPSGFLLQIKDSLLVYRLDSLVYTISQNPDFLRFRDYGYLVKGILYFYTQEKVDSYSFFGKIIVSRMRSHVVPISNSEELELKTNYFDIAQRTIDGEWMLGDVSNQLFYNDYQKENQDFRLWSPKESHE